ncbi:MAG: DNA polymerase III subunit gamma/tau [Firmicutes bacterium]|nr:DNA polymerase III subunit gamma/tau [Bacillota bacterium]
MAYLALYRKWRPQTFADVLGQAHICQALQNSLRLGRVSHAYLFSGPRGTGKTTVARLLAKGLDCVHGPTDTPCGECEECRAIASSSSLNVIEIDGASNRGIEEIRELREQARFAPVGAPYKVYIIDEVHMLTTEAFNALLKTLEEPPAHVVFIFATTDLHKVPATILSRCQRYDFKRLTVQQLMAGLKKVAAGEGIEADEAALLMIAKHAEGGMRDAFSLLEQCMIYSESLTVEAAADVLGVAPGEAIRSFAENLLRKDQKACLEQINRLYDGGRDLMQFARDVVEELRARMFELEPGPQQEVFLRAIRKLSECAREMRYALDPRIPLELAALELTAESQPEQSPQLEDINRLKERIRTLEQQVRSLSAREQPRDEQRRSEGVVAKRPAGSGDRERTQFIIDNWEEYLQVLRSERLVQSAAFLREGRPVYIRGGTAIISFPRERGFHKASIEQAKHKEAAERVLSKFVGTSLQIECVFQDELTVEEETPQPEPKAEPRKAPAAEVQSGSPPVDDTVQAALRIFGGRVVRKPDPS